MFFVFFVLLGTFADWNCCRGAITRNLTRRLMVVVCFSDFMDVQNESCDGCIIVRQAGGIDVVLPLHT